MRTFCPTCKYVVQTEGSSERVAQLLGYDIWGISLPCINCAGQAVREPDLDFVAEKTSVRLSVEDYFKALHGQGLPDEIDCPQEVVTSLLLCNKIVDVATTKITDHRCAIQTITLSCGLILHLTSSLAGATVFKITRMKS